MSMLFQNTTNFFISSVKKLDGILYPNRCLGCEKLLEAGRNWCSDCLVLLMHAMNRPSCPRCASSTSVYAGGVFIDAKCSFCRRVSLSLDGVCRVGLYESPIAEAVRNFKYHYDMYGLDVLSKMLYEVLIEQDWFEEIEAFCPIPSHWTRKFKRGFNQAEVLAERVSVLANKPVISFLKRVRATRSQAGLNFVERRKNVAGAFSMKSRWDLSSANICLIDDVMTTGATLSEAGKVLKKAGTYRVFGAIIARAENALAIL